MKKITAMIVLITLLFTSMSFAKNSNLYRIDYKMDKIRYEATVAGKLTRDEIRDLVRKNIKELASEGITNEEIQLYLEDQIRDNQKREDFLALMEVLKKQNLSQKLILDKMSYFFSDNSNQGASFMSEPTQKQVVWMILGFSAFVVALTIVCATQGGGCEDLGVQ